MKAFSAKERERIAARLRDRGRELFLRHGLGHTSISELAAAAGIGSGSFYSFYASKERLLAEILLEDCSRASLAIEDAASSRGDPARVLSALLAGLVSALGDNALLRDALCGGGATGAVLAKSDKERWPRYSAVPASCATGRPGGSCAAAIQTRSPCFFTLSCPSEPAGGKSGRGRTPWRWRPSPTRSPPDSYRGNPEAFAHSVR
jgi:AcrR family transcriptional regulator